MVWVLSGMVGAGAEGLGFEGLGLRVGVEGLKG